jgi:antitoxin CptB
MNHHEQNLELIRKRLLWRACHRGIKEMDIIVGGFATARLQGMDQSALGQFADILELPDQHLLSWLTNQEAVPVDVSSPLLLELLAFRPENLT